MNQMPVTLEALLEQKIKTDPAGRAILTLYPDRKYRTEAAHKKGPLYLTIKYRGLLEYCFSMVVLGLIGTI